MTNYENYIERKSQIEKKLTSIKLEKKGVTKQCWAVGGELNVTGTTVKNYLDGKVADGYLGEAIYQEFKRLKVAK
jgi:predicted transcriptional regulator